MVVKSSKIIKFIIIFIIIAIFTVYKIIQNNSITTYNDDLIRITLEEFKDYMSFGSNKYIYIGRDSCTDCGLVYPTLCKISKDNNLSILYYSTESDRDLRAEFMKEFLDKIGVDSVPTIVKIEDGKIIELISGEEFIANFQN